MNSQSPNIDEPEYWSALVPELYVHDLNLSMEFYVKILGFTVKFDRPENNFAYLEMGCAQIMLDQIPKDKDRAWLTGSMVVPFGRGVNFQIEVPNAMEIYNRITASGAILFKPYREVWYRQGAVENGQAEFLVQDPDGYLLRFIEHIGERPSQVI